MFKCVKEAEYLISCDWCYEQKVPQGPSVPYGWKTFPSEAFGGPPGWNLHWCPECVTKVLATRVRDGKIGP